MRRNGFTLIEMMVALAIFGLLSAGAVVVMRSALTARAIANERISRVGELARLRAMLGNDLSQAARRRVRGLQGNEDPLGFEVRGPQEGQVFLKFVRSGVENPDALPRPSLQYVEYRWVEGRVERAVRQRLDGAPLQPPQVLAQGVEALTLRAYGQGGWRPEWGARPAETMPGAIQFNVTLEGIGAAPLLIMVSGDP